MVRKILLLISVVTALIYSMQPFTAQGHGGHGVASSFYSVKGPFQQISGEFSYDYNRYGAVGKNWERHSTSKMRYAGVDADALKTKSGEVGSPSVRFRVWFLGPMVSKRPKCTFKIGGGGKIEGTPVATRYHVDVLAMQKAVHNDKKHDFLKLQSDGPWTVKFYCVSK